MVFANSVAFAITNVDPFEENEMSVACSSSVCDSMFHNFEMKLALLVWGRGAAGIGW